MNQPPRRATAKPPRLSIETLLDREVSALDHLVAEVRDGISGPRHFDELEQRADRIGHGVRDAFRKGRL